jgi:hypothetical protein
VRLHVKDEKRKVEDDTASGDDVLFGPGATNPNEASIVSINPNNGGASRVAVINRNVVLDSSIADPTQAVDQDTELTPNNSETLRIPEESHSPAPPAPCPPEYR